MGLDVVHDNRFTGLHGAADLRVVLEIQFQHIDVGMPLGRDDGRLAQLLVDGQDRATVGLDEVPYLLDDLPHDLRSVEAAADGIVDP